MPRVALLFCLLCPALLTGCGTVCNFRDRDAATSPDGVPAAQSAYGGVGFDAGVFKAVFVSPFDRHITPAEQAGEVVIRGCIAGLCIADLPFSAVGDTFTLPYVMYTGFEDYFEEGYRFSRQCGPAAVLPPEVPPPFEARSDVERGRWVTQQVRKGMTEKEVDELIGGGYLSSAAEFPVGNEIFATKCYGSLGLVIKFRLDETGTFRVDEEDDPHPSPAEHAPRPS